MKYLRHRFSSAKSLDSLKSIDDINEFKFDWITPSIIDRANEVLQKLKYSNLSNGLYILNISFSF